MFFRKYEILKQIVVFTHVKNKNTSQWVHFQRRYLHTKIKVRMKI